MKLYKPHQKPPPPTSSPAQNHPATQTQYNSARIQQLAQNIVQDEKSATIH
jgi:hypothetical protein